MGLSVIQIHSISGTLEAKEMIFTFACRVYHFWLLWGVAANLSLAHVCAENRSWAAGIKAVPHTPKNICLCGLYKRKTFAVSGRLLHVLLEPPEGDSVLCKMTAAQGTESRSREGFGSCPR